MTRIHVGRNSSGERILIAYLDPKTFDRASKLSWAGREDELADAVVDAIALLTIPEEIRNA